jgi:hypothetical protein
MPAPHLISVSPDPPIGGQNATVCYDFGDTTEGPSITLKVQWTIVADGQVIDSVTVSPSDRCDTIQVPSNAGSVLISDPTQQSADYGSAVTRPGDDA